MDLIDKYLGEGKPYGNAPSLDSLKYNPKGKDLTADDLENLAKTVKGKSGEITANVAWAMKKNDKKKVQKLIDKYSQYIIGIHDVLKWVNEK
jgi:hypothetical protein